MGLRAGYKQTEVGVIPEDWEVAKIGDTKPFVTSGSRGWAKYYSKYGDPFVRITNMTRERIYLNLENLRYVNPPTGEAESKRTSLLNNDILISITADIGICCFVNESLKKPAFINQHIAMVRFFDPEISSRFVAYFFASDPVQRRFVANSDTGAKAGMNLDGIRSMEFALPPTKAEQTAIAEALGDVDALLAGLERLITKKRNLKQAALHQLLTAKVRLPDFSDDWQVKRLGEHLTFLRNGTNSRAELTSDGPVKYLHYGDIHGCEKVFMEPAGLPSLPAERARTLDRLRDGDLVFADASEDIEGVGKSVEISEANGIELVSGLHTIAVRFDKAVLADGFKANLQFIPEFQRQLRRLVAGTKVLATNRAHLAKIEIPLPDPEEQTAIAAVLSDMDAEITALERRLAKTRDLKQAMMQELLTGRIRLI